MQVLRVEFDSLLVGLHAPCRSCPAARRRWRGCSRRPRTSDRFDGFLPAVRGFFPQAVLRDLDAELDLLLGLRARVAGVRACGRKRDKRGRKDKSSRSTWVARTHYSTAPPQCKGFARPRVPSNATYHGRASRRRLSARWRAGNFRKVADDVFVSARAVSASQPCRIMRTEGQAPCSMQQRTALRVAAERQGATMSMDLFDRRGPVDAARIAVEGRVRIQGHPASHDLEPDAAARRSCLQAAPDQSSARPRSRSRARAQLTRWRQQTRESIPLAWCDPRLSGASRTASPIRRRSCGCVAIRLLCAARRGHRRFASRHAYALDVAYRLGQELADRGVVVASGLARGVDSAAHRGCLAAGEPTVAVLGCGLDRVYPAAARRAGS